MFLVEINKSFQAAQGLRSPVRMSKDLPSLVPADGFSVILRVGMEFADTQLNERGWFVDTDAIDTAIAKHADYLASDTWTSLFEYRPTFEMVAKWSHEKLKLDIPQLKYVELDNETLQVKTRYVDN